MSNDILTELRKPFHPSAIEWKPQATTKDGTKAMAAAYADIRAYQNRLDEVCGLNWSVTYTPWGDRIVCHVTINGVTRSSTGEGDSQSEKSEIAGTAAEAQAFKRACAMFGLGRYLYNLPQIWVELEQGTKKFSAAGLAKLESQVVQHYRRATAGQPEQPPQAEQKAEERPAADIVKKVQELSVLGNELYGDQWPQVSRHNVERITVGKETEPSRLTVEDLDKLIVGMRKLKSRRTTEAPAGK